MNPLSLLPSVRRANEFLRLGGHTAGTPEQNLAVLNAAKAAALPPKARLQLERKLGPIGDEAEIALRAQVKMRGGMAPAAAEKEARGEVAENRAYAKSLRNRHVAGGTAVGGTSLATVTGLLFSGDDEDFNTHHRGRRDGHAFGHARSHSYHPRSHHRREHYRRDRFF